MPRFSIILPVRNGGEYIKDCIASILSQELNDFELLILDNCSTDGTSEWLKLIKDPRVRIFFSEKPLSIEENWGRVLLLKKSEFMTLIGHDDILNSDYLSEIYKLINEYPDATLYQTHFNYIDRRGELIRKCRPMLPVEYGDSLLQNCLRRNIDLMGTGYVMRSKDYDAIGGIPDYPNLLFADFELWINLTLRGYKVTSAKTCFSFRLHNSTTSSSADIRIQDAFERLVLFLVKLNNGNRELETVISQHASDFLIFYCQGFVHRLLRTPQSERQGISVKLTIEKFERFSRQLNVADTFKPRKRLSIRIACLLDRYRLGRGLFLLWKKLYPKPILK